MEWIRKDDDFRVPIKSWCGDVEENALKQASDLARHPVVYHHAALMPDCHMGYGMPIGGVIACKEAVIPNAVGVDIGCGMGAVQTSIMAEDASWGQLREITTLVKKLVPCGEGKAHKKPQEWDFLEEAMENSREKTWCNSHVVDLARKNLGTLGGGNHFIEIQTGDDGHVWLMIHSGSRHLGNVIARSHNEIAVQMNMMWHAEIPNKDLALLPANSAYGQRYIKDMTLALEYAQENRRRIMENLMTAFSETFKDAQFREPINIHHNYAALENHFGKNVWVHRKGATSARENQIGIIPGSMGTPSYIVRGLGNEESFHSCSHGAGRVMGRMEASRRLTVEECDKAMEGIVCDRWNRTRRGKQKGMPDLGEAPQAYKDIDGVINAQLDLIEPITRLSPLAVVKG